MTFHEVEPTPATSYWIERIWSVTWNLDEATTTSIVPHPAISLTVERGDGHRPGRHGDGVWVTGVVSNRFDVRHDGIGGAVGVKFHPGGFTALTGVAASRLTDVVVRAGAVLEGADALAGLPLDAETSRGALCAYVEGWAAPHDPAFDLVRAVVDRLADPGVTRVDELAGSFRCSTRTLQRLLQRYVGVGPKWLLRRQRLHDAVAALDAGVGGSLADLAADLGWYDQNQFARDFGRMVGVSPSAYRNRTNQQQEAS
jgi:AraC-like DNA-binding protein